MINNDKRLPVVVRAWIEQLLDPEVIRLFELYSDAQVDVRLSASKGRVRRKPTIIVNGGPSEMVDPSDLT
jgi:hypothetical protein